MLTRPENLNLSNWRQAPQNRWAFHHVREILPTEIIRRGSDVAEMPVEINPAIESIRVPANDGEDWSLQEWLQASHSDALLVAHRGRLVHEWYVDQDIAINPHIVFSVSKSMTAILAGVLVGDERVDPDRPVVDYIPRLKDSGYRDATLQQVLDMVVSIDFAEDYQATSGIFVDYRTATAWHPCAVDEIDHNLHDFLCSIGRGDGRHGEVWQYRSPNSDLLGWVLEAASGERIADLFGRYLWQPMGAEADACITVDRKGAPRTAGGICVLPRDLLRFAELVRNRGRAAERQIVPEFWIEDCWQNGSREAWERRESAKEFPAGSYRNKWYQTGDAHQTLLAIGIHSQWICIDPVSEVTIVKLSSQPEPLKLELDAVNQRAFAAICAAC